MEKTMRTIVHFTTESGGRTEQPDDYHTDKDGFVTLVWGADTGSGVSKLYHIPKHRVEFIVEKE